MPFLKIKEVILPIPALALSLFLAYQLMRARTQAENVHRAIAVGSDEVATVGGQGDGVDGTGELPFAELSPVAMLQMTYRLSGRLRFLAGLENRHMIKLTVSVFSPNSASSS